ncbi:MAG: S-layer homology domain-containing protein [Veillonellaceae bacterium]|nr:S-layer homology domain-containing protein [Veillonellaceae bacterium]
MKSTQLRIAIAAFLAASSTTLFFNPAQAATPINSSIVSTNKAAAPTATTASASTASAKTTTKTDASTTSTATTAKASTASTTATNSSASTASTPVSTASKNTTTTAKSDTKASSKEATTKATDGPFSDIAKHWAKEAILAMYNDHFISGFPDGTFRPNVTISRAQIASIYNNILTATNHLPKDKKTVTYTDVPTDNWAYDAVEHVSEAGIMKAESARAFNPSSTMTRQSFAITAAHFADYLGIKNDNSKKAIQFADSNELSSAGKSAVTQLAQEGFINAGSDVLFRPQDTITRAEAAAILYRIYTHTTVAPIVTPTVTASNSNAQTTTTVSTIAPTNLQPVTQASAQSALENAVFTELDKLYKTPGNFQNHGVMYWKDNILYVAVKSAADMDTLEKAFTASSNKALTQSVVLESTKYSQVEYDKIAANFASFYASKQPNGKIIASYPDVPHNQLIVNVTESYPYMQDSVASAFGSKIHYFVISTPDAQSTTNTNK